MREAALGAHRMSSSIYVHILTPGTCEYVTTYGKRELCYQKVADGIMVANQLSVCINSASSLSIPLSMDT